MHNTKANHHGFTIIEILSVMAILGIAAALAIPAYNDYTIKARTAELLNVASAVKAKVAEYRVSNGDMPNTNDDINLEDMNSTFVRAIDIHNDGIVNITANQTALGIASDLEFQLNPTYQTGTVDWTCTASGDPRYVPSTCTIMEAESDTDSTPGIPELRDQRDALRAQRTDLQSQRRDLQQQRQDLNNQRRQSTDPSERQELNQQIQDIRAQEQGLTQAIRNTSQQIRETNQAINQIRREQRQN